MNSGIETPIIPKTVSELSISEPRFKALIEPRMTPKKVENKRAAIDSSRVAGTLSRTNWEIGTPLARL